MSVSAAYLEATVNTLRWRAITASRSS